LQAVLLSAVSGAVLYGYFQYEKRRAAAERERKEEEGSSYGRPLVGGPFSLVNHEGRPVTDIDFRGKYLLLYFGYTFCPDVCPEELEKMAKVVDSLGIPDFDGNSLAPIFISCDPKRDSVESIGEYIHEFHPKFIGLTGTHQQIKWVAKKYRLYYSSPPKAVDDDETDYLVDHSIFFYLISPNGEYLGHFGRTETAESVTEKILNIAQQEKLAKVQGKGRASQ
ncbi:SCO1/SenC-domain-containing protein, partial [Cladochytrium replicatum]